MPITTATRGQIRATAASLMGLLVASGTTTSASGGLTIVDSSTRNGGLVSDSDSESRFDGCFCLFTSGPAVGLWRECSTGAYAPATGTLQFAASFSTPPTPGGGDTYEIYAGIDPDAWSLGGLLSIVDYGLYRLRYLKRSPISLVVDGDMEQAGTTAWTASNSTLAKSTTDSLATGTQSLIVTNTSANGYAQSTLMAVIPQHGYSVCVDYRCTTTTLSTASLQVWDATNNVLITTGVDQDSGINYEGGRCATGFETPANCYRIAFRLVGAETTAVIAWDDLIVASAGRRRYFTPSWIGARNQIMSYLLRDGSRPFEDSFIDVGWPSEIQEDPTAVNAFVVDIPSISDGRPLYVMGEGVYGPQLSTLDSTTVACPLEWAAYSAARYAWQQYGNAIEGASLARATADQAVIEKRAAQLDAKYLPRYETGNGFALEWAGLGVTKLP